MGGKASAETGGAEEVVMSAVEERHKDATTETICRAVMPLLMEENARRFEPLIGGAPLFRALALQLQREQSSCRQGQSLLVSG